MANKVCLKCKEEKTLAHYIASNSFLHTGSLPICKECLAKMIDSNSQDGSWNIVDKICQWADVPFVPEEWEKIHLAHGKDAFGMYCSIFRGEPYNVYDWKSYNDAYLKLRERDRMTDALPEIREEQQRELREKWGPNYDDEALEYLENLHAGLVSSQNIVGSLNEDQALKICKMSYIIEEKMRANVDFNKDLKAYDDLVKLANFTPKNVKNANEFDSSGEICSYLEKTGWVNKYYDGAVRDEVDQLEKNMKFWTRYLYVNETGIGEEIEERINNLKVAAALEQEEFDEKGLRAYCAEQGALEKPEDFEVNV